MSHITEGLLHAYLDGAISPELDAEWADASVHMERCEECRQRLAEARDLREAARGLLAGAAAAAGSAPPFSEILAASQPPSPRTHGSSWWGSPSRLAWAASLVLAAGAGWIGRELMIQNGRDVTGLASEPVAAVAEVEPSRAEADTDLMAQTEAESPARVAQELAADDAEEIRILEVAREIMAAAHFAALVSLDESGHPRARTMDPFPPEADMTIWMATNPASRKVEQIRNDSRVTVHYFDSAGLGYVSLMGEARIVEDPEEKARRWKSEWEAFYPDRESSYILIEVRPNRLEVVSEKHGLSGDPVTWTPDGLSIGSQ